MQRGGGEGNLGEKKWVVVPANKQGKHSTKKKQRKPSAIYLQRSVHVHTERLDEKAERRPEKGRKGAG